MKRHYSSGVTLPELLVTVVILGILSAAVFSNISGQTNNQNLKAGQQLVYQALRTASSLAISKYQNMTIEFFPYNYTTASLQNRIRICTNAATGPATCNFTNWTSDVIKQEIIMPANIFIRRAAFGTPCGNASSGAVQFTPEGTLLSSGCVGTVYLSINPALISGTEPISTIETDTLATLEPLIETNTTGAVYNAVVVSTILGKVRLIK